MTDTSVIDVRDDSLNPDPHGNLTVSPPVAPGGSRRMTDETVTGLGIPQAPPSDFMSDIEAKGDALQHSLVGPAQEAQEKQSWADRQRDDATKKDRERMERAWGYERSDANDTALRPWNADQEKANRVRGPMEQFGSVGFIFAMAASAFTRTPMTSALNAGAAAMTAIQQGDEKAYEHAYKAWKDNSDLAIRRFDMEHRLYEDANKLLDTDMNLWKQKTLEIATQFDDQKKIAMLQNGMDPDVLKAQDAAYKARLDLVKAKEGFEEYDRQQKMISEGIKAVRKPHPDWTDDNKGPEQTVAEANVYARVKQAARGIPSRELTGPQEFARRWWEEHPGGTAEEFSAAFGEFMRGQKLPAGGAGGAGARPGSINEDRTKMDAAIRAEPGHEKWTDAQVIEERNRRLKASNTGLTGNERVKLEDRINKFAHSDDVIDKTLKVLETHTGAAGIAGKVMRIEERVGNILGAKSTERVQMMRDIELLRGWAKELLFSSNSKLKKEAERVDSIVGGTSAGDTGPNTVRALRDLKNLFDQMRAEDEAKLGGTWKPPAEGESKPAPKAGKTPWSKDPIVSP